MVDMLTIRETVDRAKAEGLCISDYALRNWVRTGVIPSVPVGDKKRLIYFPNLVRFLTSGSSDPATGKQRVEGRWD